MDHRVPTPSNRGLRHYLARAFLLPDAARFLSIFAPLLAITIVIVALSVAIYLGAYPPGVADASTLQFLQITNERSLGEFYEFALLLFTSAALLFVARRARYAMFSVVALLYLWVAADGFLAVHEYVGDSLAAMVPGLDRDIGELAAFVPFGLLLIVVSLRQSVASDAGLQNALLVALIWILGSLAVGVDFLHSLLPDDLAFRPDRILGLIEEGGEMLVISAASAYSAYLLRWYFRPAGPNAGQVGS